MSVSQREPADLSAKFACYFGNNSVKYHQLYGLRNGRVRAMLDYLEEEA
jgi:hypothetical protein